MTRRTAVILGAVAWLVALLFAPSHEPRGLAVWAGLAAVAVVLSVGTARLLSGRLRRAVLKDEP